MAASFAITDLISNRHRVENVFGPWPSFHDCLLLAVRLESGEAAVVEIDILAPTDYEKGGELHSPIHEYLVTIRFNDASEIILTDFVAGNIIGELTLSLESSEQDPPRARVRVEPIPACGVELSLLCNRVDVISVIPAAT